MSKVFELAFKLGAELTGSFKGAFAAAQKEMQGLTKASEQMKSVGTSLTAKVTAPIAGLGAAAIMVGANFEEGMSKVAAVSGATGSDLEKLTAKARELGAKTQFSATEAAEGLNYMAMAGWDTQQMLGGIDGVLSLAAASGEELALVSDIVTDAMTAFGMKAEESGRFADVLAAASSSANTNVAMLGESFKYVAPLAGAMGYSAEDTSVALSLMANAGIKGSQSGTALKTMLANMASPTKQMKKSMDALGISLTNSDGSMKSLDEVMRMLRGSFADLDEIQQASAASTIFGKEAMAGALAVINASEEDFEKLTGAINNSNGAAEEMAKVVNDNLKGRIKEMQSALEEAGISIYNNLQPSLEAGVAFIQLLADKFNGMSPSAQNTILVLAGVAASIGPLLIVASYLINAFVNVKSAIAGVKGALAGLKLFTMANPIMLVVGALIALAAGLYFAYQKSEEFRNVVDPLLAVLKDVFVSGVSQVGSAVQQLLPTIIGAFATLIPVIMNIATMVLPMLISEVQTILPAIITIVQTAAPVISSLLLSIVPIIVKLASSIIPLLLSVVQMVFPIILNIIQSVLPIVITLLQAVIPIVLWLAQMVLPLLLSIVQMVFPIVLNIIQTVIPIVENILQSLVVILQGVVIPAIQMILSVVQFVFPYIQLIIENALTIINGIIQAAMALLQGDWDGAWEAIKSTATTIMDNIIAFFSGINLVEVGKSIINGLIDGIASMGSAVITAISGLIPEPLKGAASKLLGALPGFADGGVVSAPTLAWVGEGGDTESIIPWNSSQRSKDLWLQTGQAIGMLNNSGAIENMHHQVSMQMQANKSPAISPSQVAQSVSTSNQSQVIQLNYNPQYNVQNPDDLERVKQHANQDKDDLEARLEEIRRNERRTALD